MPKTWFITGASRGIGEAVAKAALAAGDQVVATGRDRAKIEETFGAHTGRALALALDVTDRAAAHAACAEAVQRFGRIDVLVNNAGYGQMGMFEEVQAADIERQFATNLFGLMNVTRAALPIMRAQRFGRIFNLSSIGGVQGFGGASIYCATKFAVAGFSESLAQEVTPFGIRVTIVEPGFFRTDFLDPSSVRWGSMAIDDYKTVSEQTRTAYSSRSHQQPGDPSKLGAALVQLAAAATPPLRFVAGSDALTVVGSKLEAMKSELEQWRALSASTDLTKAAA